MAGLYTAQPCVSFHTRVDLETHKALFALHMQLIDEGHYFYSRASGPCTDDDYRVIEGCFYLRFDVDAAGAERVKALLAEHGAEVG